VGVVGGRQAGADVEELADAGLTGQVADRTGEEGPGGAGVLDDGREDGTDLVANPLIGGEVVLAAQPVVPDPGTVRDPVSSLEISSSLGMAEPSVICAPFRLSAGSAVCNITLSIIICASS